MLLVAPNGCAVDASDEAAPKLMEQGWSRADDAKPEPKPKRATRKRSAKPKE